MQEDFEDLQDLDDAVSEEADGLYEHFRVVADKGQELLRVDKFLMYHLPNTSRNRIQQAATAGFIHVNDKPVKSNYRVKPHDVVTMLLDRPRYDSTIVPEDIPLDIVYEDEALMVINKPAGLVVHPGCGNYTGTLVHAVAWHLRDNPRYDPNDPGVGLVHRIGHVRTARCRKDTRCKVQSRHTIFQQNHASKVSGPRMGQCCC